MTSSHPTTTDVASQTGSKLHHEKAQESRRTTRRDLTHLDWLSRQAGLVEEVEVPAKQGQRDNPVKHALTYRWVIKSIWDPVAICLTIQLRVGGPPYRRPGRPSLPWYSYTRPRSLRPVTRYWGMELNTASSQRRK
jgi:hypothetical protein